MKSKLVFLSLAMMAAALVSGPALAQKESKADKKQSKAEKALAAAMKMDTLLNTKQFSFIPNKVAGTTQVISSSYEFKMTPDEIDCSLPFYGIGEGAFKGNQKNPLEFKSTDFTYSKRGVAVDGNIAIIEINVKKATTDITYKISFEIYDDQTAMVSVNAGSMKPVAYLGDLIFTSDKKKK